MSATTELPAGAETARLLVLSTAHVPECVMSDLEPGTDCCLATYDAGAVFRVPHEAPSDRISVVLDSLLALAHETGHHYLMLDCDAPVVEDLRTFDWEGGAP